MATSETVGDRLRRFRRIRKLTQDALADLAEVDRRQIGRLEAGEVLEPAVDTVKRLATALRIPVRALAEPLGWWSDETPTSDDWLSMLWADDRLDEEGKRTIQRLVELELDAAERKRKAS